jgi:hypothetical protein
MGSQEDTFYEPEDYTGSIPEGVIDFLFSPIYLILPTLLWPCG